MGEPVAVRVAANAEGIIKLNGDCIAELVDRIFRCEGSFSVISGSGRKPGDDLYYLDLLIALFREDGGRLYNKIAQIHGNPVGTDDIVFGCYIPIMFQDDIERVAYAEVDLMLQVHSHSNERRCCE